MRARQPGPMADNAHQPATIRAGRTTKFGMTPGQAEGLKRLERDEAAAFAAFHERERERIRRQLAARRAS